MMLARVIAPIHSLGPGQRVGIWFQGCTKNCQGCIAKELQRFDETTNVPVEFLIPIVKEEAVRNDCKGLTISGGDPFEQASELYILLKGLRPFFADIMVYTGYTIEEVKQSKIMKDCLQYIDVLVDGRYIEEKNTGKSRIYGSNNQRVIFFNSQLVNAYMEYDMQGQSLESFVHEDKVFTIGIQRNRWNDYE